MGAFKAIIKPDETSAFGKIRNAVKEAIPVALKTGWWLIKLIIPVSLAVTLLKYFGILEILSRLLSPLFSNFGLPGEAVLAYLSAIFLNIYSAIAVISTLPLTGREITILAVMCLISHNLIVETAVQRKTGSRVVEMLTLRLGVSLLAGFLLNLMVPASVGVSSSMISSGEGVTLQAAFTEWISSSAYLALKIIVLVSLLMILQRILQTFGILAILSKGLKPILRPFGLPPNTTFLWLVANVLGLAYGSAVMMEETSKGRLSREEADLLNYHVAISHSNLEDVLLFVAIGAPFAWLLFPRLILAGVAVWTVRFVKYGNRSFH